ncbi:class I adenylate-forming enzyme family protein [Rhizobium sp. C4]|uniref:class I adenylate-forming enzyme family protein n=1 Tax=Rhizobium sp. C4 TaxID=1349800 RepID=UPI001E446650|nr:AMP-binding protein [Rhizobium sp. C4]MCD2173665.1 AMP-binding protein [Rhizobium sp. C4]
MIPIKMLQRGLRINAQGIALVDGALTLTYAELAQQVDAFAHYLQEALPEPQARVGICAHNNWQHVIAMLGVFASGHVWVPLNPRNSREELGGIAAASELSLIVTDHDFLPLFESQDRPLVLAAGTTGKGDTISAICERHAGRRPADILKPDQGIMAIKFTGGTTGNPKGVMQPYRAFMNCIASMLTVFGFDQDERMLAVAPLTHGAGTFILPVLAVGGSIVLLDGAKAPRISDVMIEQRITASFMPPTLIYSLMDHAIAKGARYPALRHLIYGAAPMPSSKVRQAQEVFGPCLAAIYGQTEAPTMITAMTARELRDEQHVGSVGRPCPYNDVQIMGPQGEILPAGETGEVVVRGDLVMRGYLNRPDLTAETIVDGWLHTGDLGAFDASGYLTLKGRSRDVIISGGFNVYPADVEAALALHPDVRQVSVIAREDDYWGERVEAAVVRAAESSVTPEELIAFARAQVGPVRSPKAIHFLNEMPTNPVGKVTRRDVLRVVEALEKENA